MDRSSISILIGTVCEVIRTGDVPVKAVSHEIQQRKRERENVFLEKFLVLVHISRPSLIDTTDRRSVALCSILHRRCSLDDHELHSHGTEVSLADASNPSSEMFSFVAIRCN